jgi:hypothetical protein
MGETKVPNKKKAKTKKTCQTPTADSGRTRTMGSLEGWYQVNID